MVALELKFAVLFFCCFVHLSAGDPPICLDSNIFTAHVDHKWQVICPPTEYCNLELLRYKITKDPQANNNKWTFNETSTCYLCVPTCCNNVNSSDFLFSSWYSDVCNQYLSSYGFHAKNINVWGRYDDEELTYVVLKEQTKYDIYLRVPGQLNCHYIVNNHRYVKELCYSVQNAAVSGAGCPQGGVSNGGMCSQSAKVGR
ncbi:hypothetical protein EVAR_66052_1 [Eumeta japonica]|uniref:Uncharacterized protein n=1 Tax=Eumeta variegata TaxID=151549 RepID=A0A4C2AHF7_EUMVA|nr:hypothetical protein EVAR_66052_1 [Eumeta japonica]